VNWELLSYAYLFSVIKNKKFDDTVATTLHPNALIPYQHMLEVLQHYKQFPTPEHLKMRFGLDPYSCSVPFSQMEIVDRLYLEKTKHEMNNGLLQIQQLLTNPDAKVSDFTSVINTLQGKVYESRKAEVFRLSEWREHLNYYLSEDHKPVANYGLPSLDRYTGGIKPGDFILIFANTTEGKSTLSRFIAGSVASQGKKVLYFTLEESGRKSVLKTFSTLYQESYTLIRDKRLVHSDINRFNRHPDITGEVFFLDTVESRTIGEIAKRAQQFEPDVIILDQIPLFTPSGDPDWKIITMVSRQLKSYTQDTKIPIIGLTQAKATTRKQNPSLEDSIGYAYSQAQDADVCFFLFPDEPGPGYTRKRVQILKNRDYKRNQIIDLIWDLDHGIIKEETIVEGSDNGIKEFRTF